MTEQNPSESKSASPSNRSGVVGAAPAGTADEASASDAVREMFTSIAHRYDLLNHLLSMNVDRIWWNRTAKAFAVALAQPNVRVLDLCCGTGDMTFALQKRHVTCRAKRDASSGAPHWGHFLTCSAMAGRVRAARR